MSAKVVSAGTKRARRSGVSTCDQSCACLLGGDKFSSRRNHRATTATATTAANAAIAADIRHSRVRLPEIFSAGGSVGVGWIGGVGRAGGGDSLAGVRRSKTGT